MYEFSLVPLIRRCYDFLGTVLTGIFLLSGCERVYSSVTSFHDEQGLIPGKTFVIIPSKGQENNLESKEYAGLIAGELQRHGYFPVTNGAIAYYGVRFVYGISNRKTVHKMVAYTLPSSATYSSSSNLFGTYTYANRGVSTSVIRDVSHDIYTRYFDLIIFNRKTGQNVYEGRLKSKGTDGISGNFSAIAPCFIQALFKKFPGENGKTEDIVLPADGKHGCIQHKLMWRAMTGVE